MLDELQSAGRENVDAGHVARYDVKEDADADEEVALLARLGVSADALVIDIGAGTGQFTIAAARRFAHVTAVDVSPVMLDALRAKVAAGGLTNVDVVEAGFLTYEPAGPLVDAIYSRYALHHLPDFWKGVALARLRDVVRPGGVLRLWDIVYGFEPSAASERIEAWCAAAGASIEREWARDELEEHVRDEHSTFTWLLEPMLRHAGFEIEDASYSGDGVSAKYVARAV
jgi:SAM-dependent methyltransferase